MTDILNNWKDIRDTVVIVEALMLGLPVKTTDGYTYQLDDTNTLCRIAHNQTTGEDVLLKVWCDFAGSFLLNLSKRISDEELTSLCANVGLNRLKSGK